MKELPPFEKPALDPAFKQRLKHEVLEQVAQQRNSAQGWRWARVLSPVFGILVALVGILAWQVAVPGEDAKVLDAIAVLDQQLAELDTGIAQDAVIREALAFTQSL